MDIISGQIPPVGTQISGNISPSGVRVSGLITQAVLRGLSAYQVAVKNGFDGDQEQWIKSLRGETIEFKAEGLSIYYKYESDPDWILLIQIDQLMADYDVLVHKPSINNVILSGNKTLEQLGIQASQDGYSLVSDEEIERLSHVDNYDDSTITQMIEDIVRNAVTGVRGSAESIYRKGNIVIAPADLGLGNVDNTHDADKNVLSAVQDSEGNVFGETYFNGVSESNGDVYLTRPDGTSEEIPVGDHTHDASEITSGTIDIARLPAAALERMVDVANKQERFALTKDVVQNGDTVRQLDNGIMYRVVDDTKLNKADGYKEYTAGRAASVPWSGVEDKPESFTPSAHTHTISDVTDIANASVAQAAKLKTARTIGITGGATASAVQFDGTKNINLNVTELDASLLSGTADIDITGNAGTATKFARERTIEVTGKATAAPKVYDGRQNIALEITDLDAAEKNHTHTTADITDLDLDNVDAVTAKKIKDFDTDTFDSYADVWFSDDSVEGKPVHNQGLQYNPSRDILKAGTFKGELDGNAASASALTTDAGSGNQPVYFSDGVPVATTYELNKTVPADAVFTDTHHVSNIVVSGNFNGKTDTSIALSNGNVHLNHIENDTIRSSHRITGTGTTTVTTDEYGNIVVNSASTPYDSGPGISISDNIVTNTGVRSISESTTDGNITANINGTSRDIPVKGLKSAAYTESTDYASVNHKHDFSDLQNKPTTLQGYGITDAAPLSHEHDASSITSGTIDIARLPAAAIERLVVVANEAARYALTISDVQNGDTVQQEDTGVMYRVVDDTKLDRSAGYKEYTAGTASSVPWSGITGKPESFVPATHTHTSSDITDIATAIVGKAEQLANARTIALTGAVTGSGSFDGSGDLSIATTVNHTHDYAGASTPGGAANTALRLQTSAGSATNPVYFQNGIPVTTTYELHKTVPSDAVFTDTHHVSTTVVNSADDSTTESSRAITNGNVFINHVQDGTVRSSHRVEGTGNVSVTYNSNGDIIVHGADTVYQTLPNPYAISINGKTYDGSEAVDVGVIDVAHGGTGNSSVDTAPTANSTKMVTSGGVYTALSGKADSNHSHLYAGSSTPGGSATSAVKLDSDAGSSTQPVYFVGGKPTATGYSLAASVPANAVFTDTHYASKTVVAGADDATDDTEITLVNTRVFLNHVENGAVTSSHKISGTGAASVTTDTSGNIIINAEDTKYTTLPNPYSLTINGKNYDGSVAVDVGTIDVAHGGTGNTSVDTEPTENSTKMVTSDGIYTALQGKANATHTHLYAGSSTAGGSATSAAKLDSNAGSALQPVYFSGGKPVATTYSLEASVPSNAVFTDTHYTSKSVVASADDAITDTSAALTNTHVFVNHVENGAVTASHRITGTGATTVTTDASGNILINSDDTKYTTLPNPYSLSINGKTYDGSVAVDVGVIDVAHGGTGNSSVDTTPTEDSTKMVTSGGVYTSLSGKADANHTHLYAGSSIAGGSATSAVKLDSSAGTATNPVYFSGGKPVATTYSLNATVPADAVFTDTHYTSKTVVGNASDSTSDTSASLTNTHVFLNHVENGAVTGSHRISGTGATTVTTDSSGNILINSEDTKYTVLPNPYSLSINGKSYDGSAAVDVGVIDVAHGGTGNSSVDTTPTEDSTKMVTSGGVYDALQGKADAVHTHLYAGSTTAGGSANSAVKLDSSAGSSTQPIYFASGKPTACSYALNKTVPADAVFTDTHYTSKTVVASANDSSTDTDSALSNTHVFINHVENNTVTASHRITGTGATTVSTDSSGNILINSTDTKYTELPNPESLIIQGNGTTIDSYKGDTEKTINITYSNVGAAAASHGHSWSDISNTPTTLAGYGITDQVAMKNHVHDASAITSGVFDIARIPVSALERLHVVDNLAAMYQLTKAEVQIGDTVQCDDTKIMYRVIDDENLDNASGYKEYVAGSASSVPWTGVTGKPSTFTPSEHTHLYAGSSTAGGSANSAEMLNPLTDAGSATNPVFFSGGKPSACTYSLNKTVPADAVFTDTHYEAKNIVGGTATATSDTSSNLSNGKVFLNLVENGSVKSSHKISGSDAVSVTADSSGNITIAAHDTKYTGSNGITLSGTNFTNSGVRSVTAGTTNGTISVNTNGTSEQVAITGLGGAAYKAENYYALSGHTHNYAGSATAGGSATSAVALDSHSIGSPSQPVYFSAQGKPVAIDYTIESSVPDNAVFTDTHHQAKLITVGSATGKAQATTALSNGSVYLNVIENNTVRSSHKITGSGATSVVTDASGNITISSTDNDTKYTGSDGITLTGTNFTNSGVRSVSTGTTNGTISVNTNGTSAEVAVAGLGGAAYKAVDYYALSGHTHNYAGSSTPGGSATSAVALDSHSIGGSTQPVYFSSQGKPVAIDYTIQSSVPANAKFTDTHYTAKNVVADSDTETANTSEVLSNGSVYLNLVQNSVVRSSHNITGSGATSVTSDASGNIIISSTDTDTKYTGSNGITLTGTNFTNSGVRSITTGTNNGTIKVNTNGTEKNVSVYGLGSAAYTDSTDYATAGHTHKYAGSSSVGGSATSAVRLDSGATGSETKPIYWTSGGKPAACTYSLNADVPANALFTDTHYNAKLIVANSATATTNTSESLSGAVYLNVIEDSAVRSSHKITAGSDVTIVTDTSGNITISSSDTKYTAATSAPGKVASASSVGSSTNYARQDHTHGIDLATGDNNGQVKIAGTNVSVKGLGSAAYTDSGAYATSGHTHTLSIATDTGTNELSLAASTKYKLTAGGKTFVFTTPANTWRGIQNNLTSDSTSDSLSAAQGKALKALVDGKAASDHTHTLSIASDTGTNELTLVANTKYKLTAGGKSFVFTTPGDTVYTHPTHTAYASGMYKVTVDNLGHVTAATAITKADITGLGISASDHTHNLTLATDTGTSAITLAYAGKYKLTAGGKTLIFTMPSSDNTWRGIQNNLTSDSTSDSLSAYQGKVLKGLVDGKAASGHTHDLTITSSDGTSALDMTANTKYVLTAGGKTFVFTTPTDTNTWRGIQNNVTSDSTTESLSAAQGKYLKGLIDGKASSSHTHDVTIAASTGTSALSLSANSKYVLTAGGKTFIFTTPPDTTYSSKAAASGGTDVSLVTTGEKYTWNNKSDLTIGTTATTAAAGNHTHNLTIAADSGTNALTLAASTKYKLTAGGKTFIFTTPPNTVYTHPSYTAHSSGMYKITVDSSGHVSAASTIAKADITGLGISASDHTHDLTIETDSGTNALTLAYGTKYKLTAGGKSFIFTMPASDNTNTHRPIQLKGTQILGDNTTALNFAEGTNITLSNSSGTITIATTATKDSPYTSNPANVSTSASAGSSSNFARGDHVHAIALATGDSNGQVKIAGTNVTVKGINTAAYKAQSYFATSGAHTETKSEDTSQKIFLIGATSQSSSGVKTFSDNEVYVTNGVLTTKSTQIGGTAVTLQYNSTTKSLDFVFA